MRSWTKRYQDWDPPTRVACHAREQTACAPNGVRTPYSAESAIS
jgi:hypothetical protein